MVDAWRRALRSMRTEVAAVGLAYRDPRTPRAAKIIAACVLAYALSPIDLVPDVIPVLGLLDDLLLVPAGLTLVVALVPAAVMDECRARARDGATGDLRVGWIGAAVVVLLWALLLAWAVRWVRSVATVA